MTIRTKTKLPMEWIKVGKGKKTTKKQYESLLNFIESNRIILSGKSNKIKDLWKEFAASENASGNGSPKTAEQWRNIWSKWKYNVKKKSREIHLHLTGTSGSATGKQLSDMEESLLHLISKIDLGDNKTPDMLGVNISQTNLCKKDEPGIILNNIPMDANFHDYTLSFNEHINEVTLESVKITSELKPIITTTTSRAGISSSSNGSENLKSVKFPRTKPNPRYTSTILESACNSFAEGQKAALEGNKETNAATNNLADAIRELARATILLYKLKYVQHYGNEDGFDEFCKI